MIELDLNATQSETLQKASKLSLQGGGLLLFVAALAAYAINVAKWSLPYWLVGVLVAGAVLLGLAYAWLKRADARLRFQLIKLMLEYGLVEGATPPTAAAPAGASTDSAAPAASGALTKGDLADLVKGGMVAFLVQPEQVAAVRMEGD